MYIRLITFCVLMATLASTAFAAEHFVAIDNPGATPPYTNWVTAATNIQDAIDVAVAGDTVWVSNGVYNTGGRPVPTLALTNRVVIDKALFLRSVNGPEVTVIEGAADPYTGLGSAAVRAVYLDSTGAVIVGFTIRGGHSMSSTDFSNDDDVGGGVYCNWNEAKVERCIIAGNKAEIGGGIYSGHVYGSAIYQNEAIILGGGAFESRLYHCSIVANRSHNFGGGVQEGRLFNCIAYYNEAPTDPNYNVWLDFGAFELVLPLASCTTPLGGAGSFTNAPDLASFTHLSSNSICIGAGDPAFSLGTDIDDEMWQNPPSVGCDEWYAGTSTGLLEVAISTTHTNVPPGASVGMSALMHGRPSGSSWSLGDGTVITNQPGVKYSWGSVGLYSVVLTAWNDTYPGGITATVTVNVVDQPDLVITKTASEDLVPVGGVIDYTITITNVGGALASNVTLVDVLPDGVSPSGAITNNVGSVSAGSSTTISYQVTVTTAVAELVNTATVTTDSPEYFNTNNSATAMVSVYDPSISADLAEALDNTDVQFISGGDVSWFMQNVTTHDGIDAAQSGAIPNDGQSWIQATVTGPVEVTYWQKVSSEDGWYFFTVTIDGNTQPEAIFDNVNWQKLTNAIPAGIHTIRWTYCCAENAWLDEVVITPIGIVDSDGDGLPDWWETQYGLNPSVSNSTSSDADWMTDWEEYIADTDPTNSLSYFTNARITKHPGDVQTIVVDPTSTARVYQVHWTTNLLGEPQLWNLLPPEQTGTGAAITFGVTNSGNYRTGVRLP